MEALKASYADTSDSDSDHQPTKSKSIFTTTGQSPAPLPPPPLSLLKPPNSLLGNYSTMSIHTLRVIPNVFFAYPPTVWFIYCDMWCDEGTPDYLQTGQASRVRSFPHVEGNYALHVYIPGTTFHYPHFTCFWLILAPTFPFSFL